MAEVSEGEAEVEGEELEGEDAGQVISHLVPVTQEPPPESDNKKKVKGKRKKAPPPIRINLSSCKYEVLRIVQRKLGWKEVGDDDDWEIYWTDTSVSIERIMKLTKIQKINHFSGMLEICRKRAMARNLMKMARQFPQHYDFFPRTFILPGDKEDFFADVRTRGKKQVYILKPDAGCQGRGIRLVQGGKEEVVTRVLSEMATPNVVAQHYLSSPLLIHGYKFDLRIYALVLSCDPLRVFLFHEGLARICTEKYSPPKASNLDVSFMHLTNYAVNKKNEAFVAAVAASGDNGEDASKWCLAQLRAYLTSLGHDYNKVWGDIGDLIIKSLCSVQPILRNNYRSVLPPDNDGFSCFEILGYDIMLDDQLRPWLIEVNHSPSFNIDSPLDLAIKEELITQTIKLVRIDPKLIAKTKKAEKRAATSRLLEPMHVKKPPPGRQGAPAAAGGVTTGGAPGGASTAGAGGGGAAGNSPNQADGKGTEVEGEEGTNAGGSGGAVSSMAGFLKPRTAEEYEAWRAKVLATRERYEAKHMGNFTRIFPSPDPAKQALYEELLKGANENFQASFQARTKRPDAQDDKKKKEDLETESQRAERLKAKAHRDNLAQKAVERRKFKLLEQQRAQGMPMPGYLASPQPYLPTGLPGSANGGSLSDAQQQLNPGHPLYYMLGPYQYDPVVFQQYYQQAYLYGSAGAGQRMSEVFGERSDGIASASSSRPVSALSSGSAVAVAAAAAVAAATAAVDVATAAIQPPPPIRIYSGPLARAAAAGAGSSQRPMSSTVTSGRNSPLSGSAGQQQPQPQPQQQSQPTNGNLIQQQSGALPLQPFLGGQRRPSSATSRASGGVGTGCEAGEWGDQPMAVAVGGNAAGGRGGNSRTDSPSSAALPGSSGSSCAIAATRGSSGITNGVTTNGHSFSYGLSSPFQHHQELQQVPTAAVAAAAATGGPGNGGGSHTVTQPQPVRPVSVGSAHNHVRHTHNTNLETTSAYYSGFSGFQELGASEREQHGQGPGSGQVAGPGPGRGLIVNGSRPPSATAGPPASLRDKLQPGCAGNGAAAVGVVPGGGTPPACSGLSRKQSFAAALNASSIAAAAAWDAAMAATAAAAGQDPATIMQYLGCRPRPESAGQRLRPTSAAGAQRSPSPLGALPPGSATAAAALSGIGGGGGSPSTSRNGSGRYASADMFALGITTHTFMQHSQLPPPLVVVAAVSGSTNPGSPKAGAHHGNSNMAPPPSPRLFPGAPGSAIGTPPGSAGSVNVGSFGASPGFAVGPWDNGTTANGLGLAVGPATAVMASSGSTAAGRAYKQSRASGVAPYTVLMGRNGAAQAPASGAASSAPAGSQVLMSNLNPPKRRSDSGVQEEDGPAPFVYQTLSIPDATTSNPSERYSGSVAGRHWSAAPSSSSSAAAGSSTAAASSSSRQRSFTGAGSYVPVVVVTGATAGPAGTGGGAAGGSPSPSGGSLSVRPPMYPPAGGSPGLRGAGAPSSGRASCVGASSGLGKVVGGGTAAAASGAGIVTASGRLSAALPPTNLAPALPGAIPVSHSNLSMAVRGGGGSGAGGGSSTSIAALQGGIEGLQITATGLDLDSQLRSAALAALNRKGLTIKGRKVAQQ
ncbi:hypothetical protein Vretimale_1419 [Volvox reticuliferus]|uniref:Tubulin tyrosine ligase n=2 Tax=Volvox reticuliferus TaxID=1737510 RepID=A0A8J4CHI2_9CHLO|nr:hypothetical protein Vretifemale_10815 [Volvox reticuliferus]GIL95379.1 hypothetical protein Vretimale_1419 [Volvox reticuliferus]